MRCRVLKLKLKKKCFSYFSLEKNRFCDLSCLSRSKLRRNFFCTCHFFSGVQSHENEKFEHFFPPSQLCIRMGQKIQPSRDNFLRPASREYECFLSRPLPLLAAPVLVRISVFFFNGTNLRNKDGLRSKQGWQLFKLNTRVFLKRSLESRQKHLEQILNQIRYVSVRDFFSLALHSKALLICKQKFLVHLSFGRRVDATNPLSLLCAKFSAT